MKYFALTPLVAGALLAGCATPYPEPRVEMSQTPVVNLPATVPLAPTNGAIYQAAAYRPLFEDHRARLVGDTLTINIVEKVSAT
ncbi:flagellar basal body L-ring protein FlgH, partial [Chromohalobacter sp. HP20-39]|uniref:flagellar basal body L-ring protein FlgH n=1 Tax=Chromohalobacter sp. HP20-39 TaxID=3079306 RepID=UPI00294AA95D